MGIVVSGLPNVDVTGTYVITYRVKDSAGNWNDGQGTNCRGAAQYRRKVTVIDSLKPVLALRFKDKQSGKPYTIQMSNEVDETTHFSGTPGMVTTQNGVKRPGTKVSATLPTRSTRPCQSCPPSWRNRRRTVRRPGLPLRSSPLWPVLRSLCSRARAPTPRSRRSKCAALGYSVCLICNVVVLFVMS